MIFRNVLDEKTNLLEPEFDKLFDELLKCQLHKGDLLLLSQNGFRYKNKESEFNYAVGPNYDGHSFRSHNEFICDYIENNILDIKYDNYLKSTEDKDSLKILANEESKTIQFEMLLYLKIWESDYFIKLLYQIARILNSENYDWNFKIKESKRGIDSTGTRDEIIREKARNRFKLKSPLIFSAFQKSYITQIRNSIAHSNYDFAMRNIILGN